MKKTLQCVFAIAFLLIDIATVHAEDVVTGGGTASTMFDRANIELSDVADYLIEENTNGRANNSRLCLGLQLSSCEFDKWGVGIHAAYKISGVLRLVVESDYFFLGNERSTFTYLTYNNELKEEMWNRRFDINPELNIVFGKRNFHFYLVTGFSFAYGIYQLGSSLNDWSFHDDNDGQSVYTKKVDYDIHEKSITNKYAMGLNLGCGIEYQFNDTFRMSLQPTLSFTWPFTMSDINLKLGFHYCL